jgi:hypothetical protein
MEDCRVIRGCKKIHAKLDAKYFFGNSLTLGNITDISKSCMCISSEYHLPLNSKVELFIPFEKKVLSVSICVDKNESINRADIMSVYILNPSREYLELVHCFS